MTRSLDEQPNRIERVQISLATNQLLERKYAAVELISEERLLAECIENIAFPPSYEIDPYWETPVGHSFALTKQFVCGQFIRKFVDKNFSLWKMPHYWRKEVKHHFNCQAKVIGQIWRLIKLLPLGKVPRPLIFQGIILEGALVFCHIYTEDEANKGLTATDWIKNQQAINQKIRDLENPFDLRIESMTWSFIEKARLEAGRNDDFRSDYKELVSARMSMITELRKSKPKKLDQSGQAREKRGRKSISCCGSLSG